MVIDVIDSSSLSLSNWKQVSCLDPTPPLPRHSGRAYWSDRLQSVDKCSVQEDGKRWRCRTWPGLVLL